MTNNQTEEQKTEATQPESVVPAKSDAETVEGDQSVGVAEDASSDIVLEPGEADHQVITLLANLSNELQETNRISRERESVIDRLHRENQQLKHGELQQALLPIFRDLIRLYDDLKLTAATYAERAATEGDKSGQEWNCYRDTVTDILYRHGVEKLEADVGEDFNAKEHKAVGATSSADQEQDRKISKIVRDGFRTEYKIIRSVEVEVYRYTAAEVDATAPKIIDREPEAK